MPSIIPSYIYMFVAMLAVGTLLIFSFSSYATTLRSIPETEQLENLLSHVATKATQLLITTTANSNTQVYLNLPTRIGDRRYWIHLQNDALQSWIEGGFGNYWDVATSHRVFLPGKPTATGHYVSGFGPAVLKCHVNGSVLQLFITSVRDDTD